MTNQNRYRRLLALLTAVLLAAGVCIPAGISADEGEENVSMSPWTPADNGIRVITDYSIQADANAVISFDDEDGAATAIHIQSGTVSLSTVAETSERIIVDGNATVILNGVNIEATAGPGLRILPGVQASVQLKEGSDNKLKGAAGYAGLEVDWEKDVAVSSMTLSGTGRLEARGGSDSVGIGGSTKNGGFHGNIIIQSGEVYAYGAGGGAGIGTANAPYKNRSYKAPISEVGILEILDGTIRATGGNSGNGGAGIGGGNHSDTKVIIRGGDVEARGASGIGCSIGSHDNKGNLGDKGPGYYYADIEIHGGKVTGTSVGGGYYGGAGIGGGAVCDAIILITNGEVTGIAGKLTDSKKEHDGGAGIGGGYEGHASITITGGTVVGKGANGASGIGSGGSPNSNPERSSKGRGAAAKLSSTTVNIVGGTVTGYGGPMGGAGIGGGNGADRGTVNISAGTVTGYGAESSETAKAGGAGIGGAADAGSFGLSGGSSKYFVQTSVNVNISGKAKVTAVGGWGASGIGSGAEKTGTSYTEATKISVSGSDIQAYADGTKFAIDTRELEADGSTQS